MLVVTAFTIQMRIGGHIVMDNYSGSGWTDPRTLALLGASAGFLDPHGGMAAGFHGAMQGLQMGNMLQDRTQNMALQRQMMQMKMAEMQRKHDMYSRLNGALTGGGGSAPQGGFPLGFNEITALKAMGGPDLLPHLKYAQTGAERKGGNHYINPITGQYEYMPRVPEGATYQNGRMSQIPGAAETNAAFKGAETGAVEGAKAQHDLVDIFDPSSGQMVKVPRARLLGDSQGQQQGFGLPIASQRPSDKTYSDELAKNAAEHYTNLQNAGMKAPSEIAKYEQLHSLLADHDGGKLTPLGFEMSRLANSLGLKVDKNLPNKEASQQITNELALALRDPSAGAGMPGAMSDADREFLMKSVPNMSQSAEGRRQMVQARIALLKRNQEVAGMARKWNQRYGRLDATNPKTGLSFYDNLTPWSDRNSLFGGQ